ncbi:MAG: hypothetical protein OXG15_00040 [Gammaproteobacteria bacterium]|nr:hypothetical protein [Gammaproteobacteria bacterium]
MVATEIKRGMILTGYIPHGSFEMYCLTTLGHKYATLVAIAPRKWVKIARTEFDARIENGLLRGFYKSDGFNTKVRNAKQEARNCLRSLKQKRHSGTVGAVNEAKAAIKEWLEEEQSL